MEGRARLNTTLSGIPSTANSALEQELRSHLRRQARPLGSLGRLEDLAIQYAMMRSTDFPTIRKKGLAICLASHGIAQENVSAFPHSFTSLFAKVVSEGGAAINVFCKQYGFHLTVIDFGVDGPVPPQVVDLKIAPGTGNFAVEAAMSRSQAISAIEAGINLAQERYADFDLVALGEMGIGNTTSASALLCCFSGCLPEEAVGRGSGVTDDVVVHKGKLIAQALELHRPDPRDPLGVLAAVGGLEMAGIVGLCLGCAERRVPVIFDGFVCTSAALVLQRLCPRALEYAFFSHRSAERAHMAMLGQLGVQPILDLGMRLGEGTGAIIVGSLVELGVNSFTDIFDVERVRRLIE